MVANMESTRLQSYISRVIRTASVAGAVAIACAMQSGYAQDVPLLSGGVGFFTNTTSGSTNYQPTSFQPHAEPLLAAPMGKSFLFEGRAILLEEVSPDGEGGYAHSHFISPIYLQEDYLANRHVTVVAGDFLLPFNTYNERLSEIWIENFQDGPLIAGIGTLGTGSGIGGMLSGNAVSSDRYSVSYNAWFSARSDNSYFGSERSSGGRVYIFLPQSGLEIGASYDRSLQETQANFTGVHLWWEPKNSGFRLRSEYAHAAHEHGYWIEGDYRLQALGGADSWIGRLEPVVRVQQILPITNQPGVAQVPNMHRFDVALDYNLPHNTRILTSYSRQYSQFSAPQSVNIWEAGIVYRFLFPTWKGRAN
jgi:hypothetical protein